MLETALALPVFILVVLLGIECIGLAYASVAAQFGAAAAVRTLVVGSNLSGTQRAFVAETLVIGAGKKFGFSLKREEICIAPGIAPDCAAADNAGDPGDLITVRIQHRIPLVIGFGGSVIEGVAIGRNEPFPR